MRPPKSEARKKLSPDDLVSFVPMNDLNEGEKLFVTREQKSLSEVEGSYTYFADGDVLLAKITPCFENGKLGIARNLVNGIGFGSSEYFVLRPSSVLDAEFLYYFLAQDSFRETGQRLMTGAVGHKRVPKEYLENLTFPLPPLPEQRRIVAILDEAFEGLAIATANAEKNLKNARELFNANIQTMLSHETGSLEVTSTSLGEVCEIYSGAGFPEKYQGELVGDYPFFKVSDMNKDGNESALETSNNYISEVTRKILGAKLFKPNCIVFPKVGGAIVTNKKRKIVVPSCVDNNIMGLWPIPGKIVPDYLSWWLQGFDIYEFSNKAALPSITKNTVSNWPLDLPTKERQIEVALKLQNLWRQTEHLSSLFIQKLAAIAELKQSLLQKAFSGELTKDFGASVVVALPDAKAAAFLSPDHHAGLLAMAFDRHRQKGKNKTFGRVKGQKFLQFTESIGGIDLGRNPIKDAAGPNDFSHMLRAEDWAKTNQFFEVVPRSSGGGYDFKPLAKFDEHLKSAQQALAPINAQVKIVTDLILDMNSEEAELFATVHAAWNNLIIDQKPITDDAIIHEARENWHPEKLKFTKQQFRNALNSIRTRKLDPDGSAKYVGGQALLV